MTKQHVIANEVKQTGEMIMDKRQLIMNSKENTKASSTMSETVRSGFHPSSTMLKVIWKNNE
jgi:hypothetical protein